MDAYVLICPQCGTDNGEYNAFCDGCGGSLQGITPQPADAGGAVGMLTPVLTIRLWHLDLVTHQPTGDEITLPDGDSVILGRSKGTFQPAVDLKPWLTAWVDKDGARNYGISREQAIITRQGPTILIARSPNASVGVTQWPQGERLLAHALKPGEQTPLVDGDVYEFGEAFVPGSKEKAPGLLVQIVVEQK